MDNIKYDKPVNILDSEYYTYSNELVKDIAKNVKTFHHHYHILYVLAKHLGAKFNVYVECGCYYGASLILTSLAGNSNTKYYSMDYFNFPNQYETVIESLKKYHNDISNFKLLKGVANCTENIKIIENEKIDILFIDTHDSAFSDFNAYSKYVNNGGFIVFDDYEDDPIVKTFVNKIVSRNMSQYHIIGTILNKCNSFSNTLKSRNNNCFVLQKRM